MSTIDSAEIIRTILENDGVYPGDPQCFSVIAYKNSWGKETYALTYSLQDSTRYTLSNFIYDPVVLWTAKQGLSPIGKQFLETYNAN